MVGQRGHHHGADQDRHGAARRAKPSPLSDGIVMLIRRRRRAGCAVVDQEGKPRRLADIRDVALALTFIIPSARCPPIAR